MSDPSDPVLARRAQVERLVKLGQRVGFALFAIAAVAFFYGLAKKEYSDAVVAVIQWSLIIGSVVLAPSMVFSYAVKAANRADRDDDWR